MEQKGPSEEHCNANIERQLEKQRENNFMVRSGMILCM